MDGTRGNRSDLTIDGVPSTATANAGRGHRVLRAAARHRPGVQGPDRDVRRAVRQHRGRRHQPQHQGRHATPSTGTAYFAKTPVALFANDFIANANNIPLRRLHLQPLRRLVGGPGAAPGSTTAGDKTFFIVRLRGHPRRAAAQQRRRRRVPDREDADRRLLRAARPRSAVPDLQPAHPRTIAGGRIQADPFPGNIIPASLINPVARAALDYIARPRTAGARRRHRQLPEPVAARDDQIRDQHRPHRPQPHREAAALRPRTAGTIGTATTTTTSTTWRPASGSSSSRSSSRSITSTCSTRRRW